MDSKIEHTGDESRFIFSQIHQRPRNCGFPIFMDIVLSIHESKTIFHLFRPNFFFKLGRKRPKYIQYPKYSTTTTTATPPKQQRRHQNNNNTTKTTTTTATTTSTTTTTRASTKKLSALGASD